MKMKVVLGLVVFALLLRMFAMFVASQQRVASLEKELKAKTAEVDLYAEDLTKLIAEKSDLETTLRECEKPTSDQDIFDLDEMTCGIDQLEWQARVEAAAGLPRGAFKRYAEARIGTKAQQRALRSERQ
jgi:hypothetical protein